KRTLVVAAATEHQHDPDDEGTEQRLEVAEVDAGYIVAVKRTGDAHHYGTDYERLHPVAGDVFTTHPRRTFLIAYGPQHPPPGRTQRGFQRDVAYGKNDRHEDQIKENIVFRLHGVEKRGSPLGHPVATTDWVIKQTDKWLRNAAHGLWPVGKP